MSDGRREAARKLADAHFRVEDGLQIVHVLLRSQERESDPVGLLEVNEDTIASGILPLRFDAVPSKGIPFASVVIEVTPEEYHAIKTGAMSLPSGWILGEAIPRPTRANAS